MALRSSIALATLLCALSACHTVTVLKSIEVPEALRSDTTVMDVHGRQDLPFNQVIRFGDYGSSKIDRGWTQTRSHEFESNFAVRFKAAKQKLGFHLHGPQGREAQVLAVSRFELNEVELLKDYLSYPTHYANTFAGTVIPAQGTGGDWEFLVHDPEGGSPRHMDTGRMTDKAGRQILIRGVKKAEGAPGVMAWENYGFEFVQDGQTIGAVSLLSKGRVWLRQSLDADTSLVVASVATALMVRDSLKDQVAQQTPGKP
jgi:hypothetical protein